MNRNKSVLLVAACLSCALPCTAALVPVAPVGGETVDMLPAAQKKIMSLPTLSERIRLFCKRENYPVYMHCIGGADRTGSLAYVLLGVLGVDRHDLEVDWESTFYPKIPDSCNEPDYWCRESHFNDGFAKYGSEDDSWGRRIELYLMDCGVTEAEIAAFRTIMLE